MLRIPPRNLEKIQQIKEAKRWIILFLLVCRQSEKSTVGVVTAKRLGYQFIDTDLLIQEQEGKLLKEIIEEQGKRWIPEVEDRGNAGVEAHNAVISPGGSVVYCENAMKH